MAEQMLLLGALDRFTREHLTVYPVADALHDLIEMATVLLPVDGAGLSLAREGRLVSATAVPERTVALQGAREWGREGPGVEAFLTGEPVLVEDLRSAAGRWPGLAAVAGTVGVAAVASLPLRLDGTRLGALNLYALQPHDWTDDEVRAARLLAALATGYVRNASCLESARETAGQLQQALESRVVIEQAKGVLVGERGITVDEAFHLLRDHARATRMPLRAIAQAVVCRGLRP